MKSRTLFLALLLFGFGAALKAQSSLPASFGSWAVSGSQTTVPASQLGQIAGDQAGLLGEFGVNSAERADYTSGSHSATVTLYHMSDPSAAFGAFTFLRAQVLSSSPKPPAAASTLDDPVAYSAVGRNRSLFVVGNLVTEITSAQGVPPAADLNLLAQSLARKADRRPYPTISGFLPKTGLIAGSERYILGPQALAQAFVPGAAVRADWAGFESSAEAIAATYRLPGPKARRQALLLLISFPTQQLAAERYDALSKWFAVNADSAQAPGDKPVIFGTRSASLIALMSGVDSRDAADVLLNQIHYASDVTWNEGKHKLTDPSISTIVVGAILDTGAIMLLAVAAGIGFGGLRILMKLVLPGKVFDRNEDVEILQLGLTSKPIQAKDFYLLGSFRGQ